MLVFCSGVLSVLSVGILPSLFQNNIADQWLAIKLRQISRMYSQKNMRRIPSSSKVGARHACGGIQRVRTENYHEK